MAVPVPSFPWYHSRGWPHSTRRLLIRTGVATRLLTAHRSLPAPYGLVVLDGWRDPRLQKALYHHYREQGTAEGYVSDPGGERYEPPHTTGGAVDITLSWQGRALRLGTYFDEFVPASGSRALEEETAAEPARSLRRVLTAAMVSFGFCPYPLEWWHFSYGDQIWAENGGSPHALYGPVSPDEGDASHRDHKPN